MCGITKNWQNIRLNLLKMHIEFTAITKIPHTVFVPCGAGCFKNHTIALGKYCRRSLSAISAINSEFVGFPRVLWTV